MERLARAFWFISTLGFTVFLFYVYAYFAEYGAINIDGSDAVNTITNNQFFYGGLILPFILNVVCFGLATLVKNKQTGKTFFLKSEQSRSHLYAWSIGLAGTLNLFFAAIVAYLFFLNNEDGISKTAFIPFLYASLIIIVGWVLWLPFILIKNK